MGTWWIMEISFITFWTVFSSLMRRASKQPLKYFEVKQSLLYEWVRLASCTYPPSDVIIEKSDISLIKMSISFFTCRGYEVRVHDRGCSNLDKHDPIERICFYRRCRDSWYRRTNVWTPDVWRRNRPKTIRKGPKAPKGATRNKLTGRPAMNFFYKRPFFFFIVIGFSFFCSKFVPNFTWKFCRNLFTKEDKLQLRIARLFIHFAERHYHV